MDAIDLKLSCPVCATAFPRDAGAAFALHVADCTTPVSAASPSTFSAVVVNGIATASSPAAAAQIHSCALCHQVYASGTAQHVIDFHEFECARANKRKGKAAAGSGAGGARQQTKRPRELSSRSDDDSTPDATNTTATSVPPLFPPHCALCGVGGRALLHCGGECMRAFHASCLDGVMAGNRRPPSAAKTGVSSAPAEAWRCAECVRGVHACARCGFLGHTSNTLAKCTVTNCGYFLHTRTCLPATATATAPLVCPRHTCSKCGGVETDMRACTSCSQCFAASHIQCVAHASASATSTPAATATATTDAAHFTLCSAHASSSNTSHSRAAASDATLALKYRLQPGDVVLLLEFANALLPLSAKRAAPDASNQWGVVTHVEDIDGRDQLLAVCVFSDGSTVSMPNKYVLPLGTANAYASPQVMLRDCIKWHAVTELNLRAAELDAAVAANAAASTTTPATTATADDVRDAILNASCSAFYARAEKLALSIAQLFSAAREGFAFWSAHRTELQTTFVGSGAPMYVFMDTRAPRSVAVATTAAISGSLASGGSRDSSSNAPNDDDVDMGEDAQSGSTSGATGASAAGGSGISNAAGASGVARRATLTTTSDGSSSSDDDDVSVEEAVAAAMANMVDIVTRVSIAATDIAHMQVERTHATASVSAALDTATFVDGVAVAADVTFATTDDVDDVDDVDDTDARALKRRKLSLAALRPAPQPSQSPSPATTSANTFVREHTSAPPMKQQLQQMQQMQQMPTTRKERVLHTYSPLMLQTLERQAAAFLLHEGAAANDPAAACNPRRKASLPSRKFRDAFPSASGATTHRLPFFRPSVVFSRTRGRRLDGLSRLLLSQDKRNIKCYVQATAASECLHALPTTTTDATNAALHKARAQQRTYVLLDLLSIDSFRTLEVVVRTRLVAAAVEQRDRCGLRELLGVSTERVLQLLQTRSPDALELYYCSYDGSRAQVVRNAHDDWLCFCANVCHLTAVLPLQSTTA